MDRLTELSITPPSDISSQIKNLAAQLEAGTISVTDFTDHVLSRVKRLEAEIEKLTPLVNYDPKFSKYEDLKTRILNRRGLEINLENELQKIKRNKIHYQQLLNSSRNPEEMMIYQAELSKQTMSCLFMDLDKFKLVNDNYSHDKGDEMIIAFARAINAPGIIRETDLVCCFGGDEFIVVLIGANEEEAIGVGKRISESFRVKASEVIPGYQHGVSIGAREIANDNDLTLMLQGADQAMYRNKEAKKVGTDLNVTELAPS